MVVGQVVRARARLVGVLAAGARVRGEDRGDVALDVRLLARAPSAHRDDRADVHSVRGQAALYDAL